VDAPINRVKIRKFKKEFKKLIIMGQISLGPNVNISSLLSHSGSAHRFHKEGGEHHLTSNGSSGGISSLTKALGVVTSMAINVNSSGNKTLHVMKNIKL
jgi:hypothetical protein